MTSIRHNDARRDSDEPLLDAARDCILAVGWRRTTLTDVARRADVSRMTLYRRWPDMQTLLSDLMVREWSGVAEQPETREPPASLEQLVGVVVSTVRGLRENALFRKIVEVDPDLLLPYLLDRRGRTQDSMLELVEAAIVAGRAEQVVRAGDAALMARAILLTTHGFALSAQTMADPSAGPTSDEAVTVDSLDAELRTLIERYLAP